MSDYIKSLEDQNEQLKQKLAEYERVSELTKFHGAHGKVGNAILTQIDHHVIDEGIGVSTVYVGPQKFLIPMGRQEVTVKINLTYKCDDDGSKIVEFIKELSNCNFGS